jgi:HEAT repeat protein
LSRAFEFETIRKEAVEPLINFLKTKSHSPQSRSGAANILENFGKDATDAIQILRELLQDNNLYLPLRVSAGEALGNMGYEKYAVQALGDALKDLDAASEVRKAAAQALGNIGKDEKASKEDISIVVSNLKNGYGQKGQKEAVRIAIANAFGDIGYRAYEAIPILINVAKDRNEKSIDVRTSSINALGKIPYNSKDTVKQLLNIWRDSQNQPQLLINIVDAFNNLEKDAEHAIPALIKSLKNCRNSYDNSNSSNLCDKIVHSLGNINPNKKEVTSQLLDFFTKQELSQNLRLKSAEALGKVDIPNERVFSTLLSSIRLSYKEDDKIYVSTVNALVSIAQKYQSKSKDINESDLEKAISGFKEVQKRLSNYKDNKDINKKRQELENIINALQDSKDIHIYRKIRKLLSHNYWLMGILIYCISGLSISFLLLGLRPIYLLKINDFLKPYTDFTLPVIGIKIPLRNAIFLGFFNYHNRVLDAWVAQHLKSFQQEFSTKDTVSAREIHIPIPVYINDTSIAELKAQSIRSILKKQRECILIWGEAGSGKTSIACQIAKWAMSDDEKICEHPMLPVLIEEELGVENNEKQQFLSVIRGQIQDLTNEKEAISEELLEHLLRQRRILVIVDRYSELSDATRKAISPDSPDFPVNALIVTSRFSEPLGKVTKTVIQPMRIEGNFLSSFMEAYLSQRGKRKLFDDKDFFDACSRLSRIVGEGRTVTVLIAKFYAEQLIANKEGTLDTPFSKNIPDLMLSCLNETNRTVIQDKLSDRTVQKDAKAIAWECVKASFRPGMAKREDILNVLQGEGVESRLEYLEKRLRIIQTINPAQDYIRFTLDPLAEYLAGLHLVDIYNNNENEWKTFIQQIEEISKDANSVKGFLLAVQDCSVAKNTNENTKKVPDFLIKELEKYTGLQVLS